MSKWETQGRINLKMLSVEEDSLYLEIRFLRLSFCYIIASPCQPVEGEALRERKSYRFSNLRSSMMMMVVGKCQLVSLLYLPEKTKLLLQRNQGLQWQEMVQDHAGNACPALCTELWAAAKLESSLRWWGIKPFWAKTIHVLYKIHCDKIPLFLHVLESKTCTF